MKRVLNVGGNDRNIELPQHYSGWQVVLLDIDPATRPDVLCDARELLRLAPEAYDAIYCSHNLEHYHHHEVRKVLAGFLHLLKPEGFADIRVPDMEQLMRTVVQRSLDIDDVLGQSAVGPITVRDVIYGYGIEIERSGREYFAHRTGFTMKSLANALRQTGFAKILIGSGNMEVTALAFKNPPTDAARKLLHLPD